MDTKIILVGVGIVAAFIAFKLFRRAPDFDVQEYYNDILTSEKYKVKGQFEE